MRNAFEMFKTYVLRGAIALIPIALTILAVRFVYIFIDQKIMGLIDQYIGLRIPGLGIIFLFVFLFSMGLITSNVLGQKFLSVLEKIMDRIPLIKTTYQVGKQVSSTLSLPEKQVFQRVVLIEYFKAGTMVIGFVTGILTDKKTKEKLLKVFLPTPPNPTSGIVVIIHEKEAVDPGWTVDEALKMVISGGIIGPESINVEKI